MDELGKTIRVLIISELKFQSTLRISKAYNSKISVIHSTRWQVQTGSYIKIINRTSLYGWSHMECKLHSTYLITYKSSSSSIKLLEATKKTSWEFTIADIKRWGISYEAFSNLGCRVSL